MDILNKKYKFTISNNILPNKIKIPVINSLKNLSHPFYNHYLIYKCIYKNKVNTLFTFWAVSSPLLRIINTPVLSFNPVFKSNDSEFRLTDNVRLNYDTLLRVKFNEQYSKFLEYISKIKDELQFIYTTYTFNYHDKVKFESSIATNEMLKNDNLFLYCLNTFINIKYNLYQQNQDLSHLELYHLLISNNKEIKDLFEVEISTILESDENARNNIFLDKFISLPMGYKIIPQKNIYDESNFQGRKEIELASIISDHIENGTITGFPRFGGWFKIHNPDHVLFDNIALKKVFEENEKQKRISEFTHNYFIDIKMDDNVVLGYFLEYTGETLTTFIKNNTTNVTLINDEYRKLSPELLDKYFIRYVIALYTLNKNTDIYHFDIHMNNLTMQVSYNTQRNKTISSIFDIYNLSEDKLVVLQASHFSPRIIDFSKSVRLSNDIMKDIDKKYLLLAFDRMKHSLKTNLTEFYNQNEVKLIEFINKYPVVMCKILSLVDYYNLVIIFKSITELSKEMLTLYIPEQDDKDKVYEKYTQLNKRYTKLSDLIFDKIMKLLNSVLDNSIDKDLDFPIEEFMKPILEDYLYPNKEIDELLIQSLTYGSNIITIDHYCNYNKDIIPLDEASKELLQEDHTIERHELLNTRFNQTIRNSIKMNPLTKDIIENADLHRKIFPELDQKMNLLNYKHNLYL